MFGEFESWKRMEISMLHQASEEAQNLMNETITRARRGDRVAFGIIFEQHHRFIYKFIYAMLGDHESAEELTQETFLGAYKNLKTLRDEKFLKTWLCGIAKNNIYKSFRANRNAGNRSDEEVESLELRDDKNLLPDARILNKELSEIIEIAVRKLDEDKRTVFVLKEIHQLSFNEIAEITGSAIPKLKSDLLRAKIKMQMMLHSYLEVKK